MLKIVRNDIAKMKADALVNCASSQPTIGAGVESALFAKGGRWLREKRKQLGAIEHGHAKISKSAGSLPCKWVIHAVGPYWTDGKSGEIEALCNCYREVLTLAAQAKCRSLAVPLISAGNHGFPCEVVMSAAVGEITRFLSVCDMDISLVVYEWKAYMMSGKVFGDIDNLLGYDYDTEAAILKSYQDAISPKRRTQEQCDAEAAQLDFERHLAGYRPAVSQEARQKSVDEAIARAESFKQGYRGELRRFLSERHLQTSSVYDEEYLSKQVFFKVYNGKYKDGPDKDTMLKISFRLRLPVEETERFLSFAGRAFSPSDRRDQIIRDFMARGDYQPVFLDQALFAVGCPQLYGMVEGKRAR